MLKMLGPFDVPHLAPRLVRLCLPISPEEIRRGGSPPLLVMFDGQNVFHDAPSFAGGWHLHETAKKIATKTRREPAIVGIDHGGAERIHELIPWPGQKSAGKLNHLLDWLVGFLLPVLRSDFGLWPAIEHRILGGSSLGGLAAIYGHHRHPEAFGGVLSMSPSLWVGGDRLFDFIAHTSKPWTSRIYVDAGAREGGGGMLRAAARLTHLFRERGYGAHDLRFREDPRGRHTEADWRRRAPAALRFLLPAAKKQGKSAEARTKKR